MDNPSGIIQSLVSDERGTRAVVEVDVSTVCPRCAAGKGCGAGLLAGGGRPKRVEASFNINLDLAAGDNVEIALAPSNLLRASLIVYGLPMLGAVGGAGLAYLMTLGDAAAATAALVGLLSGWLVGRWRLRQRDCLANFVPTIERRLRSTQTGR